VIVRRHPEHGDHRLAAALLQEPRGLDRCDGLEEDEEGAAHEPGLLSGDDGGGAGATEVGGALGGPRCAPRLLLARQRFRDRLRLAAEAERPFGGFDQAVQIVAAASIEGRGLGPALEVVAEKQAQGLPEGPVLKDSRGGRPGIAPAL
jgi:hypothetical protein